MLDPINPVSDPIAVLPVSDPVVDPIKVVENPVAPTVPASPDVIDWRADRAGYGLRIPGRTIKLAISDGAEPTFREGIAAEIDGKKQVDLQTTLINMSRRKGGPLTTDEMGQVADTIQRNQQFTDPKSVFEYEYAKRYMEMLPKVAQQKPGSWYDEVLAAFPDHTQAASDLGAEYVAKQEVVATWLQNAQAALGDQSFMSWGADRLKGIMTLGIYGDIKERNQVPNVGYFTGLGLGSNLQAQRVDLYRRPMGEFTATFTKIMQTLIKDNPGIAVDFARSMLGMSASEIVGENFGTLATFTAIPGTGKLAGAAAARLGLLKRGVETMVDNNASHMYRAFVDSGEREVFQDAPIVPKAAIPKAAEIAALGAGDTKEAGVARVTQQVLDNMNGSSNPVQQIMDGLISGLRTQERDMIANPPVKAVGIVNRLIEQMNKSKVNFIEGVQNLMRVNRIPEIEEATSEALRKLQKASQDDYNYPGLSFLDTRAAPLKAFNIYWWEHQLVQANGDLWANRDGAIAAALEHGIGLKGQKDMTRQLELQRLLHVTEGQLSYFRDVTKLAKQRGEEAANTRAKLGISKATKTPDFEKNIKDLEGKFIAYSKELETLRNSPGATIEQQGSGFYISKYVPLREPDRAIRDLLLTTANSKTPEGLLTHVVSYLRTPDETFAKDASINAKIAAVGPNKLLELIQNELKPIAKIARWNVPGTERSQRWHDWERIVKAAQHTPDPETGEMGYLFKSEGELYNAYMQNIGRAPLPQETEAYFALKRYVAIHDGLLNLRATTDKLRLGLEEHSVVLVNDAGKKVQSPSFEGAAQKGVPREEAAIYFVDTRTGTGRLTKTSKLTKEMKTGIEQGKYTVVRVADPGSKQLAGFDVVTDTDRVRYVIAPSVETRPLSFNQLKKNNSSLFERDYDHYVAQPVIEHDRMTNTNWYERDRHLAGFMNGKLASDVADIMNQIQKLIREKNFDAAKEVAKRLPRDWAEVQGWFTGSEARFSLSENRPFRAVPKNSTTIDVDNTIKTGYGQSFRDGTTTGSDIREARYLSNLKQRDPHEVFGIADKGSRQNPMYVAEDGKFLDPIPSINRSMRRLVDSTYMDDYKIFSIEHWIQEAKQYLKAEKTSDIEHSPFYYFYKGDFLPNTPMEVKARLEGNRTKIRAILGVPSTTENWLNYISQEAANSIYTKVGPTRLDPSWMLPQLTDFGRFARSITYHSIIGLFALPQVLVQSMSFVTMAGIEGSIRASKGMAATILHQYSRFNSSPEVLEGLDRIASYMGFKPGEWKEARELFLKTGFHTVGPEHALLDNPYSARVISNAGKDFLDLGSIFFREADRNTRFGAWYMAYRRFRDANPTATIGEKEMREIFDRADLLAGNMTSASKSMVQRGLFSFPTQFMAYNLRLAELFTGKRLTMLERSRLFLTFAGAFGVSAAGIVGYPMGDVLRKSAIDNGYVPGENFINSLVYEGIPAYLLHGMTGNWYNVGARYGSPGFDTIRDVLAGDKSWYTLIGGASWNKLSSIAESTDGLRAWVASIYRDDTKYYKPTVNDFVAPLMQVSSLGLGVRTLAAINTSNWLSSKGVLLTKDISPLNALFLAGTGLQPLPVADLKAISSLEKDKKTLMTTAEQQFYVRYNRAIQAFSNNDPDLGLAELNNARQWLIISAYPRDKYAVLFSAAAKGKEERVVTAFRNFLLRNQPPEGDVAQTHLRAYGEWLKTLKNKGE